MRKTFAALLLCALLCATRYAPALADETQRAVYRLTDEAGQVIASVCDECEAGDEYISADNRHYRVVSVDQATMTAQVEALGMAEMPDVSWLDADGSMPVSAPALNRRIALYCTHSDESYRKGDGTESDEERGGIYDVAASLGKSLEALGVTVEISDALHHPHDAGAYRRSRQTAVALLKNKPNAIFDIHRDGIPDADEYAATIGGVEMSKVRLLVGRGNQNKDANLSLAKQIKAVGDKIYPRLIKDIYMGKGSYNQDLAPRSVLLEFGTHTLSKERVLRSTEPMAEVLYKTLFGGVTGAAGASDAFGGARDSATEDGATATTANPEDDRTAGSGIAWLIGALIVGLLVFALLSGGGMNKFKRSFSELSGGLFGKKPPRE